MNPFDLKGPEFLLFYSGLAAVVVLLVRLSVRLREGDAAQAAHPADLTRDPYQVAYLRSGRSHALHTAFISLMDRRLLTGSDKRLKSADAEAPKKVRNPLEKAILDAFEREGTMASAFSNSLVVSALDAIGEKLEDMGLICGKRLRSFGKALFWLATLFLWAVAGAKIAIALSRGRQNIVFLILLALVVSVILRRVASRFRTRAGDRMLANLRLGFGDLYSRRKSLKLHRPTTELMMLAALFGLSAMPATARSMVDSVKKVRSKRESGGGCGSGCGASSSCGGSSCGGGCGGGCGGCGG